MRIFLSLFIFSSLFLVSCSQIRESAGVNRKNIDEFKVVENPPLVIPQILIYYLQNNCLKRTLMMLRVS